jgi:hypothetical protein
MAMTSIHGCLRTILLILDAITLTADIPYLWSCFHYNDHRVLNKVCRKSCNSVQPNWNLERFVFEVCILLM